MSSIKKTIHNLYNNFQPNPPSKLDIVNDGMNQVLEFFKPNISTRDFNGGQKHNIENSYNLNKDKSTLFYPYSNEETDTIIQDNSFIERINNLPIDEAYKLVPEFEGLDDKQEDDLIKTFDLLKWRFKKAQKLAEKYGTMYLVLNINDGKTWDQPVDLTQTKLKIQSTKLVSSENCTIAPGCYSRYDDPELYQISNSTYLGKFLKLAPLEALSFTDNYIEKQLPTYYTVHKSRLLIFHGKKLSGTAFEHNHYRHKPTWLSCFPSVLKYETAISAAINMLKDYDVFIYKMAGLYETGVAEKEEGQRLNNGEIRTEKSSTDRSLLARLNSLITGKSITKGMIIDKELEEAEFINREYKGVSEIVGDVRREFSDRSEIPEAILFATSTGNLYGSDTGLSDRYMMSSLVNRTQKEKLEPNLRHIFSILFPKLPSYSVVFPPTIELTAKEMSDVLFNLAKSDASNVVAQVMTPQMCARRYNSTHIKPFITLTDADIKKIPNKVVKPPTSGESANGKEGAGKLNGKTKGGLGKETSASTKNVGGNNKGAIRSD